MKENSVDVWDAFLNTLENRGASSSWEVTPDVQKELVDYFKSKIDMGVVDGKTTFPFWASTPQNRPTTNEIY